MSKITFRADDELIQELEAFDASKSEVMRRALRSYLDGREDDTEHTDAGVNEGESGVDADSMEERVIELVDDRVAELLDERTVGQARVPPRSHEPQDINVNIALDGDSAVTMDTEDDAHVSDEERKTPSQGSDDGSETRRSTCPQCGGKVAEDDVYCPNCGTKSSHRVFCECGDEIRSDWGFCPSCGRRTPAADVLDGP